MEYGGLHITGLYPRPPQGGIGGHYREPRGRQFRRRTGDKRASGVRHEIRG
jgi:hypothetical protein